MWNKSLAIAIVVSLCSINAYALSWQDLWSRPAQQAAHALAAGKPEQAADLFQQPNWKGVANYRAGKYDTSAEEFGQDKSARGYYNHGNALAYMHDYQAATASYQQSLKLDPNNTDAKHNLELLKKLQQQQQQQKQSKNGASQQNQNKKDQNKHSSKQQQQDKQQPSSAKNQQQRQTQQQQQASTQSQKQNKPQQQQQSDRQQQQAHKSDQQNKSEPTKSAQQQQQTQQQQAKARQVKQWLRRIPDNPGGLLKQKFLRDHERYQQLEAQGKSPW